MGVHWGDSIAGLPRGAGVRAREALWSRFSEMAQALRQRKGGDRAQLRRLVAAGRSLHETECVKSAIFNPYDAAKHFAGGRKLNQVTH